MFEEYMDNFNNTISSFLFATFLIILTVLSIFLIISLLLLLLGCLIKSQTLKSKFLKIVPILLFGIFFMLLIPIIYINLKHLI